MKTQTLFLLLGYEVRNNYSSDSPIIIGVYESFEAALEEYWGLNAMEGSNRVAGLRIVKTEEIIP